MKYSVNKKNTTWRTVDEETIIVHTVSTIYYNLNKTGTYIWHLLIKKSMSLEELLREVSLYYKKEQNDIAPNIKSFLDNLHKENLIKSK